MTDIPLRAQRVALVEDDDGLRAMAQLALETFGGFEVLPLASGEQALAEAAAFRPDLLLLDVTLPGLDGPGTLAALRRLPALQQTPAVFLTARTQAGEVAHYRALGARDIVAKPFDPAGLCARLHAVLANAPPATPDAGRKVLVIEDDPATRFLLGFVLEQNGWQMMACEDGAQGLQAIDAGPLADLVLLDIVLPGKSGVELLQHLRSLPRWSGVPVLMLTSKGDEAVVQGALAAGADDYLGKPFEPSELLFRIGSLTRSRAA